ncbi:MAG: universal stress protein [Cyclobacteriaceae bacterium]|nr:universal stress protein [Cyclobacteriaceae bacterium]
MSKILCPVDFSDTSLNALEYASKIANVQGAVLIIYHVFTDKDYNKIVGEEEVAKTFKEQVADIKTKIETLAREIKEMEENSNMLDCYGVLDMGKLSTKILEKVNEESISLIVMGTTGFGKTSGLGIGSNTTHILEKANIPLLCIPDGSVYNDFKTLIYATDIEEEDKIMIQNVVSFATYFSSSIKVVHVNHKYKQLENAMSMQYFNELASFIQYKKIKYDTFNCKGDIGDCLLEYTRSLEGDLLVLFSQHKNFMENLFHKSIAKRLSLISSKPVLILR